ncbi:MAG: hypothetical protein WBV85_10225 [Solirubrobacteraceae bacterium]
MDAVELRGDEPIVVDTSAWWRLASLPSKLVDAAVLDDRLWITPVVRMEILFSARSGTQYITVETELDGFRSCATIMPSPMPRCALRQARRGPRIPECPATRVLISYSRHRESQAKLAPQTDRI